MTMTFQLDTTGAVAMGSEHGSRFAGINMVWSDLDAFTQGYVEALFHEFSGGTAQGANWSHTLTRPFAFSDLAPEALARIIADCALRVDNLPPGMARAENTTEGGSWFWAVRQERRAEVFGFPPLTVQLGDDGKVRFA